MDNVLADIPEWNFNHINSKDELTVWFIYPKKKMGNLYVVLTDSKNAYLQLILNHSIQFFCNVKNYNIFI